MLHSVIDAIMPLESETTYTQRSGSRASVFLFPYSLPRQVFVFFCSLSFLLPLGLFLPKKAGGLGINNRCKMLVLKLFCCLYAKYKSLCHSQHQARLRYPKGFDTE